MAGSLQCHGSLAQDVTFSFLCIRPVLSHTLKLRGDYGRDLKLAQKFWAEIMSGTLTPQQAANTKDVAVRVATVFPSSGAGQAGVSK